MLEGILSWISKGNIELLPDAATVPDKQPEATHVVQYGETLSSIAYQYGTNYQRLAALNGLTNPNLITLANFESQWISSKQHLHSSIR